MQRTRPIILVVDDLPGTLKLVARILGDGYDLVFATDGRAALTLAAEHRPDLVLLDVTMPGMDGYAVCAALKQDPALAAVPVVFLTALAGDADEARGLEAGGIDYMAKPLSPPILRARVRNHLELKRVRDRLEQLTVTDELTGIANRRCADARLEHEWRRARRSAAPLSLLMIDIDCFKPYNDAYGHPAGDACLRLVAGALAGAVRRPADLVARYGGEEFIAILPETEAAGARQVAEAMRAAVAALAVPHSGSAAAGHVTISIGAAGIVPRDDGGAAALVRRADEALYEAKRGGRNRVVAAG